MYGSSTAHVKILKIFYKIFFIIHNNTILAQTLNIYIMAIQAKTQRMINEQQDLQEKLTKLEDFINTNKTFLTLSTEDKKLLIKQRGIMQEYFQVLQLRINRDLNG